MKKRLDGEHDAAADKLEFRAAMRDVKPLSAAAQAMRTAGAQRKPRPIARAARAAAGAAAIELPMPSPDVEVGAADALSFRRAGVREQVLRRLRRGLFPVEGLLDLHGENLARARALVAEFLARSGAVGLRCVCIIHGKGMRSGSRGAVLKSAVNGWLRHHPDVMAFVSARPIDGGTGAVYVLLRA